MRHWDRDLIVLPTVPAAAPRKGERSDQAGDRGDLLSACAALTSVGGDWPAAASVAAARGSRGAQIGLSLAGAHGEDAFLLGTVQGSG